MSRKIRNLGKTKIYRPNRVVAPTFETNIITDNKTLPNGNVVNVSEENAEYARDWVDANHK